MTPEDVQATAARGGVSLSSEEAAKLVKGAERLRQLAEVVRKYIAADVEPAGTFRTRSVEGE